MGHLNHVTRRGAVYVWRRRLPREVTGKTGDFVQVSLKTKKLSTAKAVAVLVNLNFATFISCVKSNRITRAEAQAFLAEIVSLELERIEEERYFEPQATSPTQWRHRNLVERARAIALERVASMGQAAALFEDDKDELLTQGFSDVDFQRIESSITDCLVETEGSAFKGETASLAQLVLKNRGLSNVDLSVLSRIRLTGQAEAMKRSDRRQQTTPFVDLKPVAAPTQIIQSDQTIATPAPDKPDTRPGYSDGLAELQTAYIAQEFKDLDDPAEQRKRAKTRRQVEAVITQFRQAIGVEHMGDLKQEDLHYYCSVLDRIPKIYGRSAEDRKRSLQEVLERAEELDDDQIGLSGATINRNLSHIRNFLKYARSRGVRPDEELFLSDLRRQLSGDERNARLAFSETDVDLIFQHPIWRGCHSEVRRNLSGCHSIQDGLYWGPLIAAATGARREEIMGLQIADIVLDHQVPHMLIRKNRNRCLKNATSERSVPIHSRLIELGFLGFVEDMATKGHVDLFPELRPESEVETFGNVFYKPWKTALDQQLGELADRKTFHSFRHRAITVLRHNPDIPKSWVKDLVGHKHQDVTDGRYRSAAPLEQLQIAVEALSVGF